MVLQVDAEHEATLPMMQLAARSTYQEPLLAGQGQQQQQQGASCGGKQNIGKLRLRSDAQVVVVSPIYTEQQLAAGMATVIAIASSPPVTPAAAGGTGGLVAEAVMEMPEVGGSLGGSRSSDEAPTSRSHGGVLAESHDVQVCAQCFHF